MSERQSEEVTETERGSDRARVRTERGKLTETVRQREGETEKLTETVRQREGETERGSDRERDRERK